MWLSLFVTTLAVIGALGQTVTFEVRNDTETWNYGFDVDYENNQFRLDGQSFRYVSGSFHYFRTPHQYWRDRLRKMRAAGLNAVSTYVEWSLHQPEPDRWEWTGDADLVKFLQIAQQEDLLVLLRPGPYICAERDLGGFPYWLLSRVPDIRLRTNDERYLEYSRIYLNEVLEKVKPFLRGNGGPIIMVQVENEYGSYNACDTDYMNKLYDIFAAKVGTKALLYTTDGASAGLLRCGFVPGAYATVDFGTGSNVTRSFAIMRMYQPKGPFVNSEFYPGWLTHWGEPFQTVQTSAVKTKLDEMLALGASVNIYMFYGGTNFAYTSGANGGAGAYNPQLTSYDYDAPMTEAGDPTEKYFEIRNVIAKYLQMPNISLPTIAQKGDYGPVLLDQVTNLFGPASREVFGTNVIQATVPMTFEALQLPHWLVLYETSLPLIRSDSLTLRATTKDRALIYVDDHLIGSFSRTNRIYSITFEQPYSEKVKFLVENQGRLNFGNEIHDFKGISNATLNDVPLRNWNMTGFRLDNIDKLRQFSDENTQTGTLFSGPVFLRGHFNIEAEPLDTYLDTTGWGKGVAFVNGYNLGRYWPLAGPQITLYVPAPYLRTGRNELVLLELEYVPNSRKMKFQSTPNLMGDLGKFKRQPTFL